MADTVTKLRILRHMLSAALDEWINQIWRRDLDSTYCCDGRECGCNAATLRDIYAPQEREP